MKTNGKGITESELENLPEVKNVVLWQDEDGPITVTDYGDGLWVIGIYDGKLCKRRSSNI